MHPAAYDAFRFLLTQVRSADEEADVTIAAQKSRAGKLCLYELYAKPPPVWLHPAFAAEFADPFIASTAFEESELHISIEVCSPRQHELLGKDGLPPTFHGLPSTFHRPSTAFHRPSTDLPPTFHRPSTAVH